MDHFNWKATININILKLRTVGLWPKGDETYSFNLYSLWTATSLIFITFGHNFFQAVNTLFFLDNIQAITGSAYINLSQMLGLLKNIYLIRNMGKLKQLMITLNTDMFQPKNPRQRKLVEPNLKFWKVIYWMFWSMSVGALFFWATFPVLDRSIKNHRLPFLAWYPFNTKVSPAYQIAYIHQVIGSVFVATATLGVDTLIAALNMYTASQIDLLCDDLKHLGAKDFNRNLLNCIIHHKKILKFADDSNQFFNWIVFFQFFISATSIGITLFQMTVVAPSSSEFISLLTFEMAIVVEIFMYCWFGNEVQEKSKNIPYAAFESDWINVSAEGKKYMLFFVLKSQKPIRVSALNLFYLSVETYMKVGMEIHSHQSKILHTAWSYFTLLNQMS